LKRRRHKLRLRQQASTFINAIPTHRDTIKLASQKSGGQINNVRTGARDGNGEGVYTQSSYTSTIQPGIYGNHPTHCNESEMGFVTKPPQTSDISDQTETKEHVMLLLH